MNRENSPSLVANTLVRNETRSLHTTLSFEYTGSHSDPSVTAIDRHWHRTKRSEPWSTSSKDHTIITIFRKHHHTLVSIIIFKTGSVRAHQHAKSRSFNTTLIWSTFCSKLLSSEVNGTSTTTQSVLNITARRRHTSSSHDFIHHCLCRCI